jgi:LuxR family maltose regulon positive regulatory protein
MDRSAAHAARLFQVHLDTANGELRAARHRLQGLLQTQESWRAPLLLQRWARLVGAELDLAGGDPQGAVRRLALSPEADPSTQTPERLLQARALLAGDWRGADAALAPIRGLVPPGRLTVEAEVLDALVADRARDDQRAMGALRRALAEAASTGVRRPFLAWAPEPMARLLRRAHLLHPSARALVDALELSDQGPPPHHGSPQEAPELTDRERNILEYLPTLLTIPEIAAELFVSNNTVKSHLRHLYLKLDVTSRRQAVARARELGLLQP